MTIMKIIKIFCSLFLLLGTWAATQAQILTFTNFRTPAQTNADLTRLHNTYPSLTQLTSIGNSVEGRPIRVLKISSTPSVNDPTKGDVVFVAEHHAREWISVEMALYLADQLLARYATDPQLQADMNRLQIWIIPTVNPDGYNYTASPSGYRYWRKNRQNNGGGIFGVDLNRNWGYQWGTSAGGSSGSPNTTVPVVGSSKPESISKNLVFPTPEGPKKPTICPVVTFGRTISLISILISSNICVPPRFKEMFSALRIVFVFWAFILSFF